MTSNQCSSFIKDWIYFISLFFLFSLSLSLRLRLRERVWNEIEHWSCKGKLTCLLLVSSPSPPLWIRERESERESHQVWHVVSTLRWNTLFDCSSCERLLLCLMQVVNHQHMRYSLCYFVVWLIMLFFFFPSFLLLRRRRRRRYLNNTMQTFLHSNSWPFHFTFSFSFSFSLICFWERERDSDWVSESQELVCFSLLFCFSSLDILFKRMTRSLRERVWMQWEREQDLSLCDVDGDDDDSSSSPPPPLSSDWSNQLIAFCHLSSSSSCVWLASWFASFTLSDLLWSSLLVLLLQSQSVISVSCCCSFCSPKLNL